LIIISKARACMLQVNFLGHWMLTNELMAEQRQRRRSRQQKQQQAAEAGATRVVFVSSLTHPAGATQWGDFQVRAEWSQLMPVSIAQPLHQHCIRVQDASHDQ
jgi:NAD(P)-dependent dehydrogenase (short-subunit alcohol dehydrogenase family)